jgi:aryl-alcohol dehydrogenase-like predicted oxidoreductase
VQDLGRVGDKVNLPIAALSIGWVCSRPGVTAAIAGAKRPEQVRQNAKAAMMLARPKLVAVVDKIVCLHGGWPAG